MNPAIALFLQKLATTAFWRLHYGPFDRWADNRKAKKADQKAKEAVKLLVVCLCLSCAGCGTLADVGVWIHDTIDQADKGEHRP